MRCEYGQHLKLGDNIAAGEQHPSPVLGEVTVLACEVNHETSGNGVSIDDHPNTRIGNELRNTPHLHMVVSRG